MTRSPTIEGRRQARLEALACLETLPTAPISVRVSTAVKLTSIPRSTLYELIKSGEIETIKISTPMQWRNGMAKAILLVADAPPHIEALKAALPHLGIENPQPNGDKESKQSMPDLSI